MVRPLPTGFLFPTCALSLNLTWQTLTLKVSMRTGPGACLGSKLVLPLVLLGLPIMLRAVSWWLHQAPGTQVHAPGNKANAVQPLV